MPTTILYDLCPPDYYRDVLDILALPIGAAYEYQYRRKWFSDDAELAYEDGSLPRDGMLVYAQAIGYQRGDEMPQEGLIGGGDLLIATRFVRVRETRESGGKVYFSLEMRGFPDPASEDVVGALAGLRETQQVPFETLVAVLPHVDLFDSGAGDQDSKWHAVVDRVGAAGSQFQGSRFWRIRRLQDKEGREIAVGALGGKRFGYKLKERTDYSLIVECSTPEGVGDAAENARIALSLQPSDHIDFQGPNSLQPRRYGDREFHWAVGHLPIPRSHGATIVVSTSVDPAPDWPPGAEIDLPIQIEKLWLRFVVGVVLVLVGFTTLFLGWNDGDPLAFGAGLAGASMGIYLATDIVTFKSR